MNGFKLVRNIFAADGIFGQLLDESGELVAFTLEHSYPAPLGSAVFVSKVSEGTYECLLGTHELKGGQPFSTYEVSGVVGHTGILFHTGNKNSDSEGCILLGTAIIRGGSFRELTGSRVAFAKFLSLCNGVPSFTLEVENK